jgi:ribonuclease HIII
MSEKASFTYILTQPQQDALEKLLSSGNYVPVEVPHTKFAYTTPDCKIALFKTGKCLIQGKGAMDFVTFVLEPLILQQVRVGYEEILEPERLQCRMGIDESGKGDFFGPLITVSVYVNPKFVYKMKEMNVRDSKTITSDNVAIELGKDIRKLLGKNHYSIVKIGPEAYNRLYSRMKNVNLILAWAHARAIENLLITVPDCPVAISDQFGAKHQVEDALMQKGKKIKLIQKHKAESDMAVAAASVIAREIFLRELREMGKEYGIGFPKGASEQVIEVAKELVKKKGPEILVKVAKCHFRTTDIVLKEFGKTREILGPLGATTSRPKVFYHPAQKANTDKQTAPDEKKG